MTYAEKLKVVIAVLKKRFQNLGAEELIDLAAAILTAIGEDSK